MNWALFVLLCLANLDAWSWFTKLDLIVINDRYLTSSELEFVQTVEKEVNRFQASLTNKYTPNFVSQTSQQV